VSSIERQSVLRIVTRMPRERVGLSAVRVVSNRLRRIESRPGFCTITPGSYSVRLDRTIFPISNRTIQRWRRVMHNDVRENS